MRVTDNAADAGESGEFFWSALGVAAGDDDAGGGVCGVNFADSVASLGIGGGSDGAGVQDDDVGVLPGCRGAATIEELAFDRSAIGLSGAAAKLFDVEGGHYRDRIAKTGIRREGLGLEGGPYNSGAMLELWLVGGSELQHGE